MANENIPFPFGFMDRSADRSNIPTSNAFEAENLDSDALLRGELKVSDYFKTNPPIPNESITAELAGRSFRLNAGVLEFEKNKGSGDWLPVNAYNTSAPNPVTSYPTRAEKPVVNLEDFREITVDQGQIVTGDGSAGLEIRESPTQVYTQSTPRQDFVFVATFNDTVGSPLDKGLIRFSTDASTAIRAFTDVDIATAGWQDILNSAGVESGLQCLFPPIGILPTEWDYQTGNQYNATFFITDPELADGEYEYILVSILTDPTDPDREIQGLPSSKTRVTISNLNAEGLPQNSIGPVIRYPTTTFTYDVGEVWVLRRQTVNSEFIKVHEFISGVVDDFRDSVLAEDIERIVTLDSLLDEGFPELNVNISNPSETFTELYEKDNRLSLKPTDRPDLLMYSRAFDWWGWSRASSFGFLGAATNNLVVRDQSTVGGTYVNVVFTEKGIYHIRGIGAESNPYFSALALPDINVAADTAANVSNVIFFATKSPDGEYDSGEYGQKIYSYDLQNAIVISDKVKTLGLLANVQDIDFADAVGGNKYGIGVSSDPDRRLVYSLTKKGWVRPRDEDVGVWESAIFDPSVGRRFKLGYARKVKISFFGAIRLAFNVGYPQFTSSEVTYSSVGQRIETIRLPLKKGQQWSVDIKLLDSTAIVYSMWLVR